MGRVRFMVRIHCGSIFSLGYFSLFRIHYMFYHMPEQRKKMPNCAKGGIEPQQLYAAVQLQHLIIHKSSVKLPPFTTSLLFGLYPILSVQWLPGMAAHS